MEERKRDKVIRRSKAVLDSFFTKAISRKLLVFLIATALIWEDKLSSGDWTFLAIAYIFAQGIIDIKELMNKR